jgi:hypothetical protein
MHNPLYKNLEELGFYNYDSSHTKNNPFMVNELF